MTHRNTLAQVLRPEKGDWSENDWIQEHALYGYGMTLLYIFLLVIHFLIEYVKTISNKCFFSRLQRWLYKPCRIYKARGHWDRTRVIQDSSEEQAPKKQMTSNYILFIYLKCLYNIHFIFNNLFCIYFSSRLLPGVYQHRRPNMSRGRGGIRHPGHT